MTPTERKVVIRWTDKHGKRRAQTRWLSQVPAYVATRRAHGDPGPYEWRLHDRAPWRQVPTP